MNAGGAKSAVVPHPDGSLRTMYSLESPESWFEDVGEGRITNGRGEVRLDNDFAAVVKNDKYHVFLTPYGSSNGLYVSARTAGGFQVQEQNGGTSSLEFSYRVMARRKDIEGPRLQRFPEQSKDIKDLERHKERPAEINVPTPERPD